VNMYLWQRLGYRRKLLWPEAVLRVNSV
jgi:hypothetical protein